MLSQSLLSLPQPQQSLHSSQTHATLHPHNPLLQLLLRPQLISVPALLLATYIHTHIIQSVNFDIGERRGAKKKGGKSVQFVARGGRRA